ncbi:hypothetical protein [Bacillus sp. V5-8f]|uniref:hypothetical protein n=1 Tax=Bacillus sp. V5-8f TaxID=2053044 RepID=UPI000C77313F|nr:hypothetical protein [Bacillus sp. V5-8f]PLT32822.1 hypothetical protein CUU64_16920 [Bacillus sp. V5-8f]
MKTITVDQLKLKKHLSMIEQITLKDILYTWVGSPTEGVDDYFELEYTEDVFAKMEKTSQKTDVMLHGNVHFRYITLTEDNQIVIGFLDSNSELKHRIISLDEM